MQARINSLERNRRGEQGEQEDNDEEEEHVRVTQRQPADEIEDPKERKFIRLLKAAQGHGGKSHIELPIY